MKGVCKIYGLASSQDGKIRYVGQTMGRIGRRLDGHISDALRYKDKGRVKKWIRAVIRRGYEVIVFLIENDVVLHEAEKRWIAFYRRHGASLTNSTDGGEGTLGWHGNAENKRPDLAARNRAARGLPGHPISEQSKAKISAANKGRKKPWLADRNREQAGKPGHPHTIKSRAKISKALKGRVITWGYKISAAKRATM